MTAADGNRFDRLPSTAAEEGTDGMPTREEVLDFWFDRYGVPTAAFDGHSFWEKGQESVWVAAGMEPDPIAIESLGLRLLRTGGRHWKPTTNGVQRFGHLATRNVIELNRAAARRFVGREDQTIEWDGEWGYLIASTEIAGTVVPLGVGLYTEGELASMVPKARQVALR